MMSNHKIAIIDIGSNSVRLVVYQRLMRAPLIVHNEKLQCGLGASLQQTGRLDALGMTNAHAALGRFRLLLDGYGISEPILVATAAVREAEDGDDFLREVRQQYGYRVRLLSGEEEAILAAKGTIASVDKVHGVVCDLGGGSLELVEVARSRDVGQALSLPIGVLQLQHGTGASGGYKTIKKTVKQALEPHRTVLDAMKDETLYAVGGSFRTLAKLHMAQRKYPVRMLHHYRANAEELADFAGKIARMDADSVLLLPGASRRRAASIPYAANVLKRLIKWGAPKHVVFSSYGIREGLLLEALSADELAKDPLLEGARELAVHEGADPDYAALVYAWMEPLFEDESVRLQRLRRAACQLLSIPRYEISPFQADAEFFHMLKAPLVGLTHHARFLLALMAYHRFQFLAEIPLKRWEQMHISHEELTHARLVGTAFDLAWSLSGGIPSLLAQTKLDYDEGVVLLESDEQGMLASESGKKRMERLNRAMQMMV